MPRSVIVAAAVALAMNAQAPCVAQDTILRSNTRLVEIHVAAWDTQAKRVTDLQKRDFRIFDDGAEREVVSFSAEQGAQQLRDSSQPESTASNEEGEGYTVVLLDWLNASFADRLRGDVGVRKVLSTIPVRQDVAVYALGTEQPNSDHPLVMLQGFGGVSAEIVSNIPDPLALPSPEIPEPGAKRTVSAEVEMLDWNNRILDTVRGFSDLAARMARLPGKKSLIWLSTGFPETLDGKVIPGLRKGTEVLYLKEVERVLAKFNQLNITVHVVDTRGLGTGPGAPRFPDTLIQFAERTGGTVFMDRNDLDAGVQTAFEDMYSGYTLGFLVPEGAKAGMHRILVRTSRRNVRLSYRESYEVSQ